MATYAIGDIQGCYGELLKLLDRLGFDPAGDRLWIVGDLVNRGPDSLQVLRFMKDLGKRAVCVLGNHDLHLLALAEGNLKHKKNTTLDAVLGAPDRDELLHWLRRRPLMHHDPAKNASLLHAGLPPQWNLEQALACAREVETVLRGPDYPAFLQKMYGNQPERWSAELAGFDRLRFIVNCFTRLRYCEPATGRLGLDEKGPPGSQRPPYVPWFQVPGRATRGERIIFGHWSTLGYWSAHNVWAIDSGCLWGGQLTALRVRRKKPMQPEHMPCPRVRPRELA